MKKIATKPFNLIQKFKNYGTQKGNTTNYFANKLKEGGYNNIYQRDFKSDSVVLYGKNDSGNTKTYLLSAFGYKVKTNKLEQVSEHGKNVR